MGRAYSREGSNPVMLVSVAAPDVVSDLLETPMEDHGGSG